MSPGETGVPRVAHSLCFVHQRRGPSARTIQAQLAETQEQPVITAPRPPVMR